MITSDWICYLFNPKGFFETFPVVFRSEKPKMDCPKSGFLPRLFLFIPGKNQRNDRN